MTFEAVFDGIWASASLLHVPRQAMGAVLARFVRELRPGRGWYMSFKLGDGERVKGRRLFNDQDETSLRVALAPFPDLEVLEFWRTADRRPRRADETWLNALVRRAI
jgi:hypothetical protein